MIGEGFTEVAWGEVPVSIMESTYASPDARNKFFALELNNENGEHGSLSLRLTYTLDLQQ